MAMTSQVQPMAIYLVTGMTPSTRVFEEPSETNGHYGLIYNRLQGTVRLVFQHVIIGQELPRYIMSLVAFSHFHALLIPFSTFLVGGWLNVITHTLFVSHNL